jgi:1,4-dihydroxy-2-naphthoyl-CoA hydrolase
MAANLHAGPGRLALGVDINATHTRSATSGLVTGVCTPVHLGRSLTVHEIAVSDDQGRRLSTVRITNMIKSAPTV